MITNAEYIPTWVLRNKVDSKTNFVLLPMSKYIDSSKSTLAKDALCDMKKAWYHTKAILKGKAK